VLAELAHTLGLALDRPQIPRAAELLPGFDPDRLCRRPVTLP
jgi:hypothetical protein